MISVIIPCNKDRGFLERAYQSVMNQTYRNFEVIVEMDNKTLSENVNNAVSYANGNYIKILSEDDILPPNSLMDLRKSIGYSSWVIGWGQNYYKDEIIDVKPYPLVTLEKLLERNYLHGGAVLYTKNLFMALSGFDEQLHNAEEYEFHLRILKKKMMPAFCPSFVYDHYVSDIQKSRTQRGSEQREKELQYIKQKYV